MGKDTKPATKLFWNFRLCSGSMLFPLTESRRERIVQLHQHNGWNADPGVDETQDCAG
jgi:hypothetical protein